MTGVQERLQRKYIWWQEPHLREERFIAQVMNIGDFDDVQILLRHAGEEKFRRALRFAEPGWFNARSWSYWHLRLGLTKPEEEPPPLPVRHLRDALTVIDARRKAIFFRQCSLRKNSRTRNSVRSDG